MHNTRSTNHPLEPYNSEIERTLFRLKHISGSQLLVFEHPDSEKDIHSDSDTAEIPVTTENMARETRTLKELTAPNLAVQPLCITFPALDDGVTFELKSGLIHQLPSFSGTSIEDPNKHLSDFHIVCTGMKPVDVTDEQLKLRAFPFSLKGNARDWLINYLPPASITTWIGMKKAFLEKYFPPSRSAQLKRAISNIEQQDGETLYEYLEKFKQLCASCPYHGYSEHDLIMYFCGGLNQDDRRMIHSACGGNIANKNPDEAWEVITELAETSRQFERRPSRRGVSAMGVNPGLEEKVDNIASTLRDMLSGRQMAVICGICSTKGHPSDLCPQMQESDSQTVNGVWESIPNKKWDPYSNTYNEGWKAHPNFRWGNSQANPSSGPPRGQFIMRPQEQPSVPQAPPQATPSSSMSTEDMIRALTISVTQDRAENKQNFKNLENQVSQLATAVNRLEAKQSGTLPSQTVLNPRENVSAVSLRNGRQLVEIEKPKAKPKVVTIQEEEELVVEDDKLLKDGGEEDASNSKEVTPSMPSYEPLPPFPEALNDTRKKEPDTDIYETFRKCEVNIPLLELIKSVPRYAKFLKELCTIKRNQKERSLKKPKGKASEFVSALFKSKTPPKCSDPGVFTIPCTIGDTRFERAMLDLGASINVIPFHVYESLKLGPLKSTRVVVQLANRSSVHPRGVVENVMVKVDRLAFPADFYVLDMAREVDGVPILLGRPFLKTAGTRIDVPNGSLTMEFNGRVVKFEINPPNLTSSAVYSLCAIATNHTSMRSRKPPLSSKDCEILQDSPPGEEKRCILLWENLKDAEAGKRKGKTWFDKLIRRKGSGKATQVIYIKSSSVHSVPLVR
ncbi:uncharacterized protein LOC141600947 [Silene latifolia]|uniref:uncharacterized protein LOC141600947 n=1 Tax=Silene latifolia TaxID=37657 RepID=UPI003D76EE74